jgi:hypothetical protein
LIERGFDAVGYVELAQALAVLRQPDGGKPGIIVLELRGLAFGRHELRALARAGIPTVLLGGAVELNEELVGEFEWAAVMQRPFAVGAVVAVVEEVSKGGTPDIDKAPLLQ